MHHLVQLVQCPLPVCVWQIHCPHAFHLLGCTAGCEIIIRSFVRQGVLCLFNAQHCHVAVPGEPSRQLVTNGCELYVGQPVRVIWLTILRLAMPHVQVPVGTLLVCRPTEANSVSLLLPVDRQCTCVWQFRWCELCKCAQVLRLEAW